LQRKEVEQSLYASQCKGGEGVLRELHTLAIIQLAQQQAQGCLESGIHC